MTRYILRRVVASLILIVAVTTVTFVMQRVLPIDPVESLVGPIRTEERLQALREQLGLDKPLIRQYADYMSGLARGDLGTAWHTGQPVTSDLASRFAASLELGLVALIIGVPLGVVLGVVSARRRDDATDYAVRGISLSFIALPEFLVALLAVNRPIPIFITGLFFSCLQICGLAMQRNAGVSWRLSQVLQAVVIVAVACRLAIRRGERRPAEPGEAEAAGVGEV